MIARTFSFLTPTLRCTQSKAGSNSMRETILELILWLAASFAVDSLLCMKCPGRLNKAKENECPGKYTVHPQITKRVDSNNWAKLFSECKFMCDFPSQPHREKVSKVHKIQIRSVAISKVHFRRRLGKGFSSKALTVNVALIVFKTQLWS